MVLCFSSPGKLTRCLPSRGRKVRPREDGCLEPTNTRDRGRAESRPPPHLELQVGTDATPVPSWPLSYLIFLPRWTPLVFPPPFLDLMAPIPPISLLPLTSFCLCCYRFAFACFVSRSALHGSPQSLGSQPPTPTLSASLGTPPGPTVAMTSCNS